ncbi:XrtN system VIT domain-containing protein [Paraflavitalea pollutisoli]|uniref:XrtN system VIT domain-containing protein n=1 Tax=Paraflavitalea pollutisoli TaxID=3034143 RepID=UPI0023EB9689|nr:XrtN system VIT domain-containing protein [Paraflavitalea sp. H1-2-19X]
MSEFITRLKTPYYLTGVVMILLSTGFFCLPLLTRMSSGNADKVFIANFVLAVIYFFVMLAARREEVGIDKMMPLLLFAVICLISCYALNREMNVFCESTAWFSALLVIVSINLVLLFFFHLFPYWLQQVSMLLLGLGTAVYLYLACYLLPHYPEAVVVFWALGFSLHIFVPLVLFLIVLKFMRYHIRQNKRLVVGFLSGVGIALTVCIVFVIQWSVSVSAINKAYRMAGASDGSGLPPAIEVARQVPNNYYSEKVFKAGMLYDLPSVSPGNFFSFRWTGFNQMEKQHDPLVMIAALFRPAPALTREESIQILEANYDARHITQERFWSGENLVTDHINTIVRIWPQFGLSYTEKSLLVRNKSLGDGWRNNDEEALYTFHLPEGAVVTALSLWIEGKEEKGILTSKGKADTAYRTIVGRERRDPSLLHWQEGNTVTVRVFPVPVGQSRQFKLGITAPLLRQQGKLIYENVWFDGPGFQHATEDAELQFAHPPHHLDAAVFSSYTEKSWKRSGAYDPNWQISLGEQPLSLSPFCFEGSSYTVHPYTPQRQAFNPKQVYLDINSSWTRPEFETVIDLLKDKEVLVYLSGMVRVTPGNRGMIFEQLQQQQFSMFPLFEISHPAQSLLISKSDAVSPNLKDLGDSRFAEQLKAYLPDKERIALFNIGSQLSPYLKSLKEYRVFNYEFGNLQQLKSLMQQRHFVQCIENSEQVVIDDAGLLISKRPCAEPSKAPDHLMRLFAYNHIMQQVGSGLLVDRPVEDSLISEARTAYVVSPVSSLVVLETKKDYERFGIEGADNSLQNASMHSNGAVPEPHEWALIIIGVLAILVIKYKPSISRQA